MSEQEEKYADSVLQIEYAGGECVLVSPEQTMPTVLTEHTYAKVISVTHGSMTVRPRTTKGGPATKPLTINIRRHQPPKVSLTEYNSQKRLGQLMRRGVLITSTNFYQHGQVVGYVASPPGVIVRLPSKVQLTLRPDEVMEIPDNIAFLNLHRVIPHDECSVSDVLLSHDEMIHRIKGDEAAGVQPITDPAEIYLDISRPPSNEPQLWINPITGAEELCRPWHVIQWIRWEDDFDAMPASLILGEFWSSDPGYGEPSNPRLLEEEKEPIKRPQYKPRARNHRHVSAPQQQADVDDFSDRSEGDQDWMQPDDDNRDNDTTSEHSSILDLLMEQPVVSTPKQPVQTLRQQHNLEPVDPTVVVKHRYQFMPTTCNRNTFKVFFDKQYHETPVMTLLEEWLGTSTFPFLATPQKLIRLHNAKFGFGGLTGADFRRISLKDKTLWVENNSDILANFGVESKSIPTKSIQERQDLKECYGNLAFIYSEMGSSTSKPHFAKMKQCVDSLQQEDCHTVTEVIATVRWLDTINQQFAAAIASDLRTGLMTHVEITKKFVKDDPDLTKAKYVIMRDHYHDDYAAKNSGKKSRDPDNASPSDSKPKVKKAKKPLSPRSKTHPHDNEVMDLLPKVNGKTVCLRHLSSVGCFSKSEPECTTVHRCHSIPKGPLPEAVIKHITTKWKGISSKFPSLTSA